MIAALLSLPWPGFDFMSAWAGFIVGFAIGGGWMLCRHTKAFREIWGHWPWESK